MPFRNPIAGTLGTLVRDALQSLGFTTGVSGWRVKRDGTAEFGDTTIRGDITSGPVAGGHVVISNGTATFYNSSGVRYAELNPTTASLIIYQADGTTPGSTLATGELTLIQFTSRAVVGEIIQFETSTGNDSVLLDNGQIRIPSGFVGRSSGTGTGTASIAGTTTFIAAFPYSAVPRVQLGPIAIGTSQVVVNLTAVTNTNFSWRISLPGGGNISIGVVINFDWSALWTG